MCNDEANCNGHLYSCEDTWCSLECETTGSCEDVTLKCNDKLCIIVCTQSSCQNVTVITSDINMLIFICQAEELQETLEDCNQMGNQIEVNGCNGFGEIRMKSSNDSDHCLTVGSLGILFSWLGEPNLVWQSVSDENVYCPQFCYNKQYQQISAVYDGIDYSLEIGPLTVERNQIGYHERNAKLDKGDGDYLVNYDHSIGNICAIDSLEDNCCLEIDDDKQKEYERGVDTFKGYEAKFECNGDKTNTKQIYFHR